MSGWEYLTAGEIIARDGGEIKTGPFGTTLKASEYSAEGVPLISVGEVGNGKINLHPKTPRVSPETTARLPEYVLRSGDIVFGRKGAVERSAIVSPDQDGWFLGSDGIRLRLPSTCDARYVAFWMQSNEHREWIQRNATGSTMASLNQKIIARIPIPLPPLPEQRAIAATLGALDDKIELNRKMNATLEAMARALFRDWFVDFGPTRAKMAGLAPYLSPALWDLFPARLDAEAKPEGWTASTIGEEVRVVGGSTPSTAEAAFWDGTLNWATPKDLSNLSSPVLLETSRKITEAGLGKISSGLLPVGTVLLSSRAPIGYLAIAEVPVAINQGFIGMVCEKHLSNVYVWLWTLENMEAILSKANGSTFQEISKGNFRPLPVVRPDDATLAAFNAQAEPLYARIAENERTTRTLAQTRDLLLPRLMSGELRVAQAEQSVAEVL